MTYPNTVISMPSNLFTLNDKFKAVTNGSVYIGEVGTVPTVESNQIQVYIEQENGTLVPVDQPIKINAAGILVDSEGQIQKFVLTNTEYSMIVQNAFGVEEFNFPRVYDQGIATALEVEERVLGVGVEIYRGKNGQYVKDGDEVPLGTTHLTILINGKSEDVSMSPIASGTVASLTETSATIGGVSVYFYSSIVKPFKTVSHMLSHFLGMKKGDRCTTGGTVWELVSGDGSDISHYTPLSNIVFTDFYQEGKDIYPNDSDSNQLAIEGAIIAAPSGSKVIFPNFKDGALFTFWLIKRPIWFGGAQIGTKAGVELVGDNYTFIQCAQDFDNSVHSALVVNTDVNSFGVNVNLILKCRKPDGTTRLEYGYKGIGTEKIEFGSRFYAELGSISPVYIEDSDDVKSFGGAGGEQFSGAHFTLVGTIRDCRIYQPVSINMGGLIDCSSLNDGSDVTVLGPHCSSYPGGIGRVKHLTIRDIKIRNPHQTIAGPVAIIDDGGLIDGVDVSSDNVGTTFVLRIDADTATWSRVTSQQDFVVESLLDSTGDYNYLQDIILHRNSASSNNVWIEIVSDTQIDLKVTGNAILRYYQGAISRFIETTETTRSIALNTGENLVFNFKSKTFLTKNISSGVSIYDVLIATNINGKTAAVARQTHTPTPANYNNNVLFWFDKRISERTTANDPVGNVTPIKIGEEILRTSNNTWYKSYGLTSSDWSLIS